MAKPWTITVPYTTTGATTIANLLDQTPIQHIGGPCTITVYGTSDAAGDTFNLTEYDGATPGRYHVVPGTPVPVASTAGAAKTNESFIGMFAISGSSNLSLPVTTSAAHTGRFQFVVS